MTVRIDSRFATANETADVLGVSRQRVKQLKKLIYASMKARRASGISWTAPAGSRKAPQVACARIAAKKSRMMSPGSLRTKPSRKSNAPRRTLKRGKKSKTAR